MRKTILLLFFLVLAYQSFVLADINLTALRDSSVRDWSPSGNYASNTNLVRYTDGAIAYSYFQFNFSDLSNYSSSLLKLYVSNIENPDSNFYLIGYYCNDDFVENTITWNNRNTQVAICNATPFFNVSLDLISSASWLTKNITKLVNGDSDKNFTLKFRILPEVASPPDRMIHIENTESITKEYPYILSKPIPPLLNTNISIYNEMTGKLFDFTGLKNVSLDIFCKNSMTRTNIIASKITINIGCQADYINLWFNYVNSSLSYYRTLIPTYNSSAGVYDPIKFYMIDAYNNTALRWTIVLNDMFGEYSGQPMYITKHSSTNGTIEVIRQYGDVSNKFNLYLIKDETYIINMINKNGILRVIGSVLADEVGDKKITLPPISFQSDINYLANDINLSIVFDNDTSVLRVYYLDAGLLTDSVNILLYNATNLNEAQANYTTTSNGFTYSVAYNVNKSYVVDVTFCHQALGCVNQRKYYSQEKKAGYDYGFFSDDPATVTKIKHFLGMCAIVSVGLIIPAEFVVVGFVLMLILFFVLPFFGWLSWNNITIGVFSVMCVLEIIRLVVFRR